MTYFILFMGLCFLLGSLSVASNPSPHYGVLGLVVGSVMGCGWLVSLGASFLALVLFMVYLGGMLVVFVYSVALAADPFPEAWDSWGVFSYGLGMVGVLIFGVVLGEVWKCLGVDVMTVDSIGTASVRFDFGGVAMFYSCGVGLFLMSGWGLLLTLFVVLELVRGLSRGAIRAV
uniref:NADH-ubiquinone oxidoreductase chain 6 n=1 Tax=Upupa epops TaxID=57439 RepID=A0A3G2LKV9_UPUEP|nr:NADH dehydrogenase subunit 6 [Upupa epops]